MSQEDLEKREPKYIEPFDVSSELPNDYKVRVACSLNHFNEEMKKTIEMIDPVDIIRLGGAGNKVNRVALDEADSYVQPRPGLSFWDLCAPEVIVRAMGGLCTDMEGNRLSYGADMKPKLPGFVIGKSPLMHALIFKRLLSKL
jgi:3'(2'), 5'-bisphosphate nucleotidase